MKICRSQDIVKGRRPVDVPIMSACVSQLGELPLHAPCSHLLRCSRDAVGEHVSNTFEASQVGYRITTR